MLILHLPHSGTAFPWTEGYTRPDLIAGEVDLLTDWHTERIFALPGVPALCPAWSRVFCDVERFVPDELEPMAARGMGFYYTHTDAGLEFRQPGILKDRVLTEFYRPHHETLRRWTHEALDRQGRVLLLDGHSFARRPFRRELDQRPERPDICLGTEAGHTPPALAEAAARVFREAGLSVAFNAPYAGALVPEPWRGRDQRVQALMIEVNRRLYLKHDTGPEEIPGAVDELNRLMRRVAAILEAMF